MSRPVMVTVRLDDLMRLRRQRDRWRRRARKRLLEESAWRVYGGEKHGEVMVLARTLRERDVRDEALRAEIRAELDKGASEMRIAWLRRERPLTAAFVGPPWADPADVEAEIVDGVS